MTLMQRRRALMGAKKGDEDGMFQKLETITLTESTRTVDFDLTQYPDIKNFIIRINSNLSSYDWIYLRINGSREDNAYTAKSSQLVNAEISITNSGIARAWFINMTSQQYNYKNTARPNTVGFVPYNASTYFNAGSTFELFGAKLP